MTVGNGLQGSRQLHQPSSETRVASHTCFITSAFSSLLIAIFVVGDTLWYQTMQRKQTLQQSAEFTIALCGERSVICLSNHNVSLVHGCHAHRKHRNGSSVEGGVVSSTRVASLHDKSKRRERRLS